MLGKKSIEHGQYNISALFMDNSENSKARVSWTEKLITIS